MTLPLPSWVVAVLMSDDLLALNRAVGIIRRRNLALSSVSLGPTPRAGVSKLTTVVATDEASVVRMANALRKMVGVLEVSVTPEADCVTREHALVRVGVSPQELAAVLDIVELYQGRVVEEAATELLIEATGTPATLLSLLRALEPFGVLDVVRGGAIALTRDQAPDTPGGGRQFLPLVRPPRAIPA